MMKKALVEFISFVISADMQVEVLREVLYERSQANALAVFQEIDKNNKSYIGFEDLFDILKSSEVSEYEIQLLIEHWSSSYAQRITYSEFVHWAYPSKKYVSTILLERIQISADLTYSIRRLFEKEIEFIRKFNHYKKLLGKKTNYSFDSVFRFIDVHDRGKIYLDNLQEFCNKNSIDATSQQLELFFRRFDKNNHGVIFLSDFSKVFDEKPQKFSLKFSKTQKMLQEPIKILEKNSHKTLNNVPHNNLSLNKHKRLKEMFRGFILLEKHIEKIREELSLRIDFTVEAVFRIFDKKGRGIASELDFDKGLRDLGIKASANEIFLVYRHFDRNNDGMLDIQDFRTIFMAKKQTHAILVQQRKPKNMISIETKYMISQALRYIIEIEKNSDLLRENTMNSVSLREAFDYIDSTNSKQLSVNDFRETLLKYNIQPTRQDLSSIVERFDSNKDGVVSFAEFVQEITPKSPSIYSLLKKSY